MNKPDFSFFITVSLLLLLTAASAWNGTSELRYDGCAPGDTVRECLMAAAEKEDSAIKEIYKPKTSAATAGFTLEDRR
ncbi:unnamed protein product [Brassica rapa subsp. trilocularis]